MPQFYIGQRAKAYIDQPPEVYISQHAEAYISSILLCVQSIFSSPSMLFMLQPYAEPHAEVYTKAYIKKHIEQNLIFNIEFYDQILFQSQLVESFFLLSHAQLLFLS